MWLLLTLLVTSCSIGTNPVTGKTETQMISEQREICLGMTHYPKLIQADGGKLVIDPKINAYVHEVGLRLAIHSGRSHLNYEFTVVNSSDANAWALPGGKIAITRGLLMQLESEAELAAVLSHEIVHAAGRHWANSHETSKWLSGLVTGLSFFIPGAATFGASVGSDLYLAHYSRSDETEADTYGMKMMVEAGYDATGMVRLQKHFLELAERRARGFSRLFATHPPTESRIRDAEEQLGNYPLGGLTGKEAYSEAMYSLTKQRKAYALLDQGRNALEKKDMALASQVGQDLRKQTLNDPDFYVYLAKLEILSGQKHTALEKLNKAIELNDTYYVNYYTRGRLYEALGQFDLARLDLQKSNSLFPTKATRRALRRIAKK